MPLSAPLPAPITARFRLERHLRSGGMGQVWLAHDLEWDSPVALKLTNVASPAAATSLRAEFRAFTFLEHRNLARFFALVGDEQQCAYSMEYVEGQELQEHVRAELAPGAVADASAIARLEAALVQLLDGVTALHAAGLIHRDLKPANILVDRAGRLVIVDPGIAVRLDRLPDLAAPPPAGTLHYMAPEQIFGDPEGTATDWYAVGAVVFELLAGRPIFSGPYSALLTWHEAGSPLDATALPGGAEGFWASVLADLLHRRPERRAVGVVRLQEHLALVPAAPTPGFIGRQRELAALDRAWASGEGARVIEVRGLAGTGKSKLVDAWIATLRRRTPIRVVRGRCDPRESVPFAGLDMLPPLVHDGDDAPSRPPTAASRAKFFAEARQQVLAAATAARPLLVVLDGAHLAAPDTHLLLEVLTRPPLPAHLTFILTTRPSPDPIVPPSALLTAIELGALPLPDAAAMLGSIVPPDVAARLAATTGGHPLLLSEVLGALRSGRWTDDRPLDDLAALVDRRLDRLDPPEREVFASIALIGAPATARAIYALGLPEARRAVSGLLDARLLRMEAGPDGMRVLPSHSAFAEQAVKRIPIATLPSRHAAIAQALHAAGDDRAPLLSHHHEQGNDLRAAASWALRAAQSARQLFAFVAGARAYARAFALDPTLATPEVRSEEAEVLAAAGRGVQAAEVWLAAAGGADGDPRYVMSAASELLKSSQVDRGSQLLGRLARRLGYVPPTSRPALLLGIAWNHLRLYIGMRPRAEDELTLRTLLVGAAGLTPTQALASHWYATHYVLRANASGDPLHEARAAALEAILLSRFGGSWLGRGAAAVSQRAFALAEATGDVPAMAYASVAAGGVAWVRQDVPTAIAACDRALALYATVLDRSVRWERSICRLWLFGSLSLSGDVARCMDLADEAQHDAELLDDPWALNSGLFGAVSRVAVLRGDYLAANRAITSMLARCGDGPGAVGAVLVDEAEADVALAQGDIVGAWAAMARGRKRRKYHGVEVIPSLAVSYYSRRAAIAAAVAAGRGELPTAVRTVADRVARRDRQRLAKVSAVFTAEIATVLDAHADLLRGGSATRWDPVLERVEATGRACGHGHWAAAAAALRLAARGQRDGSWAGGRYVDLMLPGLVPADPRP